MNVASHTLNVASQTMHVASQTMNVATQTMNICPYNQSKCCVRLRSSWRFISFYFVSFLRWYQIAAEWARAQEPFDHGGWARRAAPQQL
jgi:hypothetical protein